MKEESKRENSFDFLKIIAATLILFHHYQQVTETKFQNMNFYNGDFNFAILVEFFFILSGYLVYKYINKNSLFKSFILKKAMRLLPLVAISAITFEILFHFYQLIYHQPWYDGKISVWGTIITSLGVQDGWVFENPNINNPVWYVSVLMLCYIIFYLLTYIGKRCKIPCYYLYILMIFIGLGIKNYSIELPFFNSTSSRGYYSFFTGVMLCVLMKGRTFNFKTAIKSLIILIVTILLMIFRPEYMEDNIDYILTFIFFPTLIIFFKTPLFNYLFKFKIWRFLGRVSYNVYIWHIPLLMLMYILIGIFSLNVDFKLPITMITFTLITWLFGILSYYFIEEPIENICKKHYGKLDT